MADRFEPISWEQAMDEIAGKMRDLVDQHGPRCLAYMGGGAQGGHMEAAFGLGVLRAMGSQYYYSSAGQEFSGSWWVTGRVFGKQYNVAIPDEHETEMLVAWGWNGMQSHQMPQAPKVLTGFSKDPDRLLVVNDIVMSETTRLAHYVLPCRSFYEAWDATFFPWTYPGVFFQVRRPIVDSPRQCLEAAQIHTLLADKLGIIPEIPDEVQQAAESDRITFGAKLMEWAATETKAMSSMPFVLAKTLGRVWDSAAKAALWGMLMTAPKIFRKNAARAGFECGIDQGDRIFQALLDTPQGLWIGQADADNPMDEIKTPSGKIEIYIPELEEQAKAIDGASETEGLNLPEEFPLILNADRHMKYNANTLMRNPDWNKGKRACTVAVSIEDAEVLNLENGQQVRVTTEAGSEVGELQVTDQVRQGMVLIPHGFSLIYYDKVYGINVNRLTKNTHRDSIGTPLHRYVPCRVEPV